MHKVEGTAGGEEAAGGIEKMLHQRGVDGGAVVEWWVEGDGVEGGVGKLRTGVIPRCVEADIAGGQDRVGIGVGRLCLEAAANSAAWSPPVPVR